MSWKDGIITEDPEEDNFKDKTSFPDDVENQSESVKELKADIVELVEDGKSKSEIFEELDRPKYEVRSALLELQSEEVLQEKQ